MKKFGKQIHAQTIWQFLRQKLQWVVVGMEVGPMISDKAKAKRMEFAQRFSCFVTHNRQSTSPC